MKLHDIIKQIDYLCEVKIVQNNEAYEEEELYNGSAFEVPWWITDMCLDGEGCISVAENMMIIYVKENANVNQDN